MHEFCDSFPPSLGVTVSQKKSSCSSRGAKSSTAGLLHRLFDFSSTHVKVMDKHVNTMNLVVILSARPPPFDRLLQLCFARVSTALLHMPSVCQLGTLISPQRAAPVPAHIHAQSSKRHGLELSEVQPKLRAPTRVCERPC